MAATKGKRPAPSDEEMTPPVYEEGSNVGPNISESLNCEHLDADLYRSNQPLWRPARARGVFGGQVIGQAVTVSNRSVRQEVRLHSLHCYFLLAGDETIPIYYQVSRLRDGGSYVTRLVEAKQRGRCIFVLFTSYAKPEPDRPRFAIAQPASIDHAYNSSNGSSSNGGNGSGSGSGSGNGGNPEDARPASASSTSSAPSSSELRTGQMSIESRFSRNRSTNGVVQGLIPWDKSEPNEQRYIRVLTEHKDVLPKKVEDTLRAWIKDREGSSIEIRDALPDMYDEWGLPTAGYEQAYWMRAKMPVAGGEDAQKAALSYASDMNLLGTVAKALGNSRRVAMMASLDHSMWFYEPFDFNKPLLFFMQCQIASNGRGLAMGRFYSEDGTLLAVVSQEGLVRANDKNKSGSSDPVKVAKL